MNLTLDCSLDDIQRERERRTLDVSLARPEDQAAHFIDWCRRWVRIEGAHGGVIPFDLYDYQEVTAHKFFAQVASGVGGEPGAGLHMDKSRQMGDTWLMMALELWTVTYWSHFRVLNLSRKQDRVDDGGSGATTESLHGKLRFMWKHLPEDKRARLTFRHLRVISPSGGVIVGEASVPDAGAGGTYRYGLWDETARTDRSWSIYAAWQQAVRCPIYLSTPKGKSNVFGWLKKHGSIEKVRHHWTQHPEKSEGAYRCPGGMRHPRHMEVCLGGEWRSPWYDAQCKLNPPYIIAQELDISYEASVPGRAFPTFDATRHGRDVLEVEPGAVWLATIDPGVTMAAMTLQQWVNLPGAVELRIMAHWEGENARSDTYVDVVKGWEREFGIKKLDVTGDPSGYNRDLSNATSVFDEMKRRGVRVQTEQMQKNVEDRVRMTNDLLAGGQLPDGRVGSFAFQSDLHTFAERMEGAKWPTNQDGVVTRETDLEHNEHEHTADSMTYGVAWHLAHRRHDVLPDRAGSSELRLAGLKGKTF